MVHTEPEWDDLSRGRVLRLAEYEASLCHCGCGQTIEVSRDPKANFVVHEDIDYARIAMEKVRTAKREAAKNRPGGDEGWDDGLTLWVEYVTPERAAQMQAEKTKTVTRKRTTGGN